MVYHYCNVGTFLNIIKNHTLRMSDIFKSTDNLEAKSILDLVQNRIYDMYVKDEDLDVVLFMEWTKIMLLNIF